MTSQHDRLKACAAVVLIADANHAEALHLKRKLDATVALDRGIWGVPGLGQPYDVTAPHIVTFYHERFGRPTSVAEYVTDESPKVKDLKRRINLARRQRDRRTETMLVKELNAIF